MEGLTSKQLKIGKTYMVITPIRFQNDELLFEGHDEDGDPVFTRINGTASHASPFDGKIRMFKEDKIFKETPKTTS